ncbi:hypothetical protein HK098_002643 [Nowakowskiella sp. JEL0407]|nr:hypothetical protein HK098_002643 [Nowakowskiella sp. JEL0407]
MVSVKVGDKIPDGVLKGSSNPEEVSACAVVVNYPIHEKWAGKKVVVFAVPGAFTPGCHIQHLPGFIEHYQEIKAKGVDIIACISANDAYVLDAWGKHSGASGKIEMLSDGLAAWTGSMGLTKDLSAIGFGLRTERFAMYLDDLVVKYLGVDAKGVSLSSASTVLASL